MLEKLDFMLRFWDLQARYGALGALLSNVEQIELLSLIRLMSTDLPLPDAGPAPNVDPSAPVRLTVPGGFLLGELRLVCAGGLVIACDTPLRAGQSTLLSLANEQGGVEYTLPCLVTWTYPGPQAALALRVDGAPERLDASRPQSEICEARPARASFSSTRRSATR